MRRVETELLEDPQGARRQPVAAALVARERRLVDERDVATGAGEHDGGGRAGRPAADDEDFRVEHRRSGYGPMAARDVGADGSRAGADS